MHTCILMTILLIIAIQSFNIRLLDMLRLFFSWRSAWLGNFCAYRRMVSVKCDIVACTCTCKHYMIFSRWACMHGTSMQESLLVCVCICKIWSIEVCTVEETVTKTNTYYVTTSHFSGPKKAQKMQVLFEQWLSAGEDWSKSKLVQSMQSKESFQKRGARRWFTRQELACK